MEIQKPSSVSPRKLSTNNVEQSSKEAASLLSAGPTQALGPKQKQDLPPMVVEILAQFQKIFRDYKYNVIAGIVFGIALQRGRVHESSIILGQMNFSHFVMLKMFLSASATSILGSIFIEKYLNRPDNRECMTEKYPRGAYGVMIGASLLGFGMTLTGSCPGSVFAQLGALSISSLVLVAGGILGAVAYGQYEGFIASDPNNAAIDWRMKGRLPAENTKVENLIQAVVKKQSPSLSASDLATKFNATNVGYGIAAMMFTIVIMLEILVNWRDDISNIVPSSSTMSWWFGNPPMVSGLLVGSAQFISKYYTQRGLGASSSFACVASKVFPNEKSPYFCHVGTSHMYQVASMMGVVMGSFISAVLTGSIFSYVGTDISIIRNFIGGFLLVFGAQFSGGCTSGHGISGMSYLSTYALLGVACMFGSAILSKILFF